MPSHNYSCYKMYADWYYCFDQFYSRAFDKHAFILRDFNGRQEVPMYFNETLRAKRQFVLSNAAKHFMSLHQLR